MANRPMVALVGSDSLLGREVRDLVAAAEPGFSLRLIAALEEQPGTLTRQGDEPAIIEDLTEVSLAGVHAIILAGNAESTSKALDLAPICTVIDLTGATEELPDARLRAPLVEGEEGPEEGSGDLHVIAHPAAIALALFLRRLHSGEPIRRAVIEVFAPASAQGMAGVTELQQQTVNLLAFKNLPQAVFDTQLAFNLLARYGEEAPVALEELELRIERHLATLLALPGDGEGAPMPSLRVIQAPVFHGYTFSAWVEFESNPGVDTLEQTLGTAHIDVRIAGMEPPTNVGVATQGGITVGVIQADRNEAEACWFWIVADNVRLAAENAVEVARQAI